ncbi:MAG: hypothetical protein LBD76_00610 [Prevotellaceae bacterium]|jgi:hypothetical protein|nr:hypothetical protein [Prevotellaceae bacterium]
MKRIIYFLLIVAALYSCTGQYDNIGLYATEETVYVGKFGDAPNVRIGYNRVEIDLMNDRLSPDDIYLGKAKKTVVEYEETDGVRRVVFDSVCSWVNITGLTTPKTYIFKIYAEDEYGNKSVSVEAMGKPFTDEDLAGYSFPLPNMIPTPTTMDFRWTEETGLSSSLFNFAELNYSYTNRDNKVITGHLTSKDAPRFSIVGLVQSDNFPVSVVCRIIPIMESGPILDTVTMEREFFAKTASPEEYLSARELRPLTTARIHDDDNSKATISWGTATDHLAWTKIRYLHSNGNWEEVFVDNRYTETLCTDIKRGVKFQIQCSYNPPQTNEEYLTEWADQELFMVKYNLSDWTVVPRNGNHPWGGDGVGSQTIWSGGHPMLILDDDPRSGWHSRLSTPFPQLLIVDMKKTSAVSKFILNSVDGGYWNNVELYLTNDLSMPGYTSHTVNWTSTPEARVDNYSAWVTKMIELIPANPPAASWGSPIAKTQAKKAASLTFLLPETLYGQFLIVSFPDNNLGWATYIDVHGIEVYSE